MGYVYGMSGAPSHRYCLIWLARSLRARTRALPPALPLQRRRCATQTRRPPRSTTTVPARHTIVHEDGFVHVPTATMNLTIEISRILRVVGHKDGQARRRLGQSEWIGCSAR